MATWNGYLVAPGTTRANSGVITLTGLPVRTSTAVKAQGVFDVTIQLLEGTISSTSNVNVQYTLSQNYAVSSASSLWVTVSTLSLAVPYGYIAGHAYAVRLVAGSTNTVDNYGIAWFGSDKR